MLKVWAGLEARSFLQASIESVSTLAFCILTQSFYQLMRFVQVERCVKYDLLSPNV